MLFLQLKSGEYLTIGEDITIQVFRDAGERIRVAVKAPKDIVILRGEVRERTGTGRPDGLIGLPPLNLDSNNRSQLSSISSG